MVVVGVLAGRAGTGAVVALVVLLVVLLVVDDAAVLVLLPPRSFLPFCVYICMDGIGGWMSKKTILSWHQYIHNTQHHPVPHPHKPT